MTRLLVPLRKESASPWSLLLGSHLLLGCSAKPIENNKLIHIHRRALSSCLIHGRALLPKKKVGHYHFPPTLGSNTGGITFALAGLLTNESIARDEVTRNKPKRGLFDLANGQWYVL